MGCFRLYPRTLLDPTNLVDLMLALRASLAANSKGGASTAKKPAEKSKAPMKPRRNPILAKRADRQLVARA